MARVHDGSGQWPLDITDLEGYNGVTKLTIPDGIAISGNYMFVAFRGSSAIASFDISDLTSITQVDVLIDATNMTSPGQLVVKGNYLIVAANLDGLVTIDITDPTNMSFDNFYTNSNVIRSDLLTLSGNTLFVGDGATTEIATVDVTDPTAPSFLDIQTSFDARSGLSNAVGGYVYSIGGNSVFALNATDPSNLSIADTETDAALIDGGSYCLVYGSTFIGGSGIDNWWVTADVSTPSAISLNASVAVPTGSRIYRIFQSSSPSHFWFLSNFNSSIYKMTATSTPSVVAKITDSGISNGRHLVEHSNNIFYTEQVGSYVRRIGI